MFPTAFNKISKITVDVHRTLVLLLNSFNKAQYGKSDKHIQHVESYVFQLQTSYADIVHNTQPFVYQTLVLIHAWLLKKHNTTNSFPNWWHCICTSASQFIVSFFQWNFIISTHISSQVVWPSTEQMPAWSSVIWKLLWMLHIKSLVVCAALLTSTLPSSEKKKPALFWRSWRLYKCQPFITAWSWTIN